MKRRVRLSTCSAMSSFTSPAIWLRKPCSAIAAFAVMPDVPDLSEARTSWALLPMLETTPSPVTTTRRMWPPSVCWELCKTGWCVGASRKGMIQWCGCATPDGMRSGHAGLGGAAPKPPGYLDQEKAGCGPRLHHLCHELRFQADLADAGDFAVDIMAAIDQPDVLDLGADLDRGGGAPELEILDNGDGIALGQRVADAVADDIGLLGIGGPFVAAFRADQQGIHFIGVAGGAFGTGGQGHGWSGSVFAERHFHVLDLIDHLAVGFHDTVGHAHGQAAGLHGLGEIDVVGEHLAVGAHHAGELHLAHAERVAAPLPAAPAEVEAGELPEAIEAKAAGHDRVAGEVTLKKPQVGLNVELRHDMALAVLAAIARDIGDPVHHQHGRFGQLRIAGAEKLALCAFQKVVTVEAARVIGHSGSPFFGPVAIL